MRSGKYFIEVYKTLFHHVAGWLIAIVLLVLCSLATLLISLILPWQLLALMDAGKATRWQWLGTDHAMMWIGMTILGAFIAHLLCEWAIGVAGKLGAERLLKRHAKVGLPSGYQHKTRKYFTLLAKLLSSSILFFAVVLLLCVVYPFLALGVVLYLSLWLIIGLLSLRHSCLQVFIKPTNLVKFGWLVGFIFILTWIVFSYPYVNTPPVLWIIVCVIATRQMLIQVFTSLVRLQVLWRDQEQVFLLFLAHRVGTAVQAHTHFSLQTYLYEQQPPFPVLTKLLHQMKVNAQITEISCSLVENGHVAYVTLIAKTRQGETAYLLKLYDTARFALAEHEALLMQHVHPHWPTSTYLAHYKDRKVQALLWSWSVGAQWLSVTEKRKSNINLRTQILSCCITHDVEERYYRAHAPLHECWVSDVKWDTLLLVSTSAKAQEQVRILETHKETISTRLSRLPAQLILPSLLHRRMAKVGTAQLWLANWSRWEWGPVGAGWPSHTSLETLTTALRKTQDQRPELAAVNPMDALLACRVYLLRLYCVTNKLHQAEKMVEKCLEALEEGIHPVKPASSLACSL
ncbi:hypothetical protein ACLPHM_14100 [Paenalcaligenes sp. Me131]|uniref:hypothetical protein n=1 Tax=Paenalcaligenes sp. Me131 TaxID=3392636 RepID=UPI003D2A014D